MLILPAQKIELEVLVRTGEHNILGLRAAKLCIDVKETSVPLAA